MGAGICRNILSHEDLRSNHRGDFLIKPAFAFYIHVGTIEPMRYLGIDYGIKRIGLALSDDDGQMAFPGGIVMGHGDKAIKEIAEKIKKENIGVIVVGLPIGLNGNETDQTSITRAFVTLLKKTFPIPIETENEMLTSRMAIASGARDDHIDASSAAIILQSYLDKIKRK